MPNFMSTLTKNWHEHAQVKNSFDFSSVPFDKDSYDFTDSLLPFSKNPRYLALDNNTKGKIHTCAWFLYNQKTLDLEMNVVNPICQKILLNEVEEFDDLCQKDLKLLISQLLTDEAYHVYMVYQVNAVTETYRNLSLKPGSLIFVEKMNSAISKAHDWHTKNLILFAVAIVAEILTSKSMETIMNSQTIQEIHTRFTLIHWQEDVRHGNIFKFLSAHFYKMLSDQRKTLFNHYLIKAIEWFCYLDISHWLSIFAYLNIDNEMADSFIQDVQALEHHKIQNIDPSVLNPIRQALNKQDVSYA